MKFVFINPNRYISKENIWNVVNSLTPPMGLACLSSILEEKGYESDIIDAAALGLDSKDIISSINQSPDYIGITSTTVEINYAIEKKSLSMLQLQPLFLPQATTYISRKKLMT